MKKIRSVQLVIFVNVYLFVGMHLNVYPMEASSECKIGEAIGENSELDVRFAELMIENYDLRGPGSLIADILPEYPQDLIIRSALRVINDFRRKDVIINIAKLMLYKTNKLYLKDANLSMAISFMKLLADDDLDTGDRIALYNLWDKLPKRLRELHKSEQKNISFDENLSYKVKNIISFFETGPILLGRFYIGEYENINEACENSEECLKKIVLYFFDHFAEYELKPEHAYALIHFLFPELIDTDGNNMIEMVLAKLSSSYPKLSSLACMHKDLIHLERLPVLMKAVINLNQNVN